MTTGRQHLVQISVDGLELEGELIVPEGATGLVVFAHGSGSSRHSPRNNSVAEVIRERGLGTLLFDLLTEAEDRTRETRFEVPLLTDRLDAVTDWLEAHDEAGPLAVGYFGSSTAAAAELLGVLDAFEEEPVVGVTGIGDGLRAAFIVDRRVDGVDGRERAVRRVHDFHGTGPPRPILGSRRGQRGSSWVRGGARSA